MIEIKFTGQNFKELRLEIQEFAIAHLGFKIENVTVKQPEKYGEDPVKTAGLDAMKELNQGNKYIGKKRGPKPKTPVETTEPNAQPPIETAPIKEEIVIPAEPPQTLPSVTAYTREDCANRIRGVNDKYGMDKARECLIKFGANKLSELNIEKYSEFVKHCDAVIAT